MSVTLFSYIVPQILKFFFQKGIMEAVVLGCLPLAINELRGPGALVSAFTCCFKGKCWAYKNKDEKESAFKT